ncbi:hypothetical protein PCCS19_21020 [Paenibacillus sp. CCS19]|uniref:hypothetical protein n=1 Tax=Paenibacillus sp. CCS19 TaxID=3158387 RepID=UPI00256E70DA|nr:hypothetical protein [Paenibacillus cellulosilyticus]GMK39048.1 hypothetical protein PCCS19_21020 [Paenibacillus cellulosilyticus]
MKHKTNIFREVKALRETVQYRIKDNVYNDELEVEHKRLEAIDEVLRYLKNLSIISHEKTKERIHHYLKKANLNARTTAAAFDVSVNAIEVSVKYVSDKIRSLIGTPLKVIEQANDISTIESGMVDFRKVTETGTPVYRHFLAGVEPYFPKPRYNPKFSLADCQKEISRIAVFAHYAEQVLSKECDQDKLAHILSLVSSLNGSVNDREALKRFFSGEFGQSETGENLNIREQMNQMHHWHQNKNPYID